MKQKETEKARVRKIYASAGTRAQKMVSFRLDNENEDWLNRQTNKGRYLNNLIEADRNKKEGG